MCREEKRGIKTCACNFLWWLKIFFLGYCTLEKWFTYEKRKKKKSFMYKEESFFYKRFQQQTIHVASICKESQIHLCTLMQQTAQKTIKLWKGSLFLPSHCPKKEKFIGNCGELAKWSLHKSTWKTMFRHQENDKSLYFFAGTFPPSLFFWGGKKPSLFTLKCSGLS